MSAGRILVVDDEPQIRRIMRATLTGSGYEVDDPKTGEEARIRTVPGTSPPNLGSATGSMERCTCNKHQLIPRLHNFFINSSGLFRVDSAILGYVNGIVP